MLNFRNSTPRPKPTRSYIPRTMRHVMMLIVLLLVVMMMMQEAGKPKNWRWIDAFSGTPRKKIEPEIDPSVRIRRPHEEPYTFRSPKEQSQQAGQPDGGSRSSNVLDGVDVERLNVVLDNSPLSRSSEHGTFFHVLSVLNETDHVELAGKSVGQVTYRELYRQPASYRGRVVTLQGSIIRVVKEDAAHNEDGIDELYKIIFWPFDSRSNPVQIYSLEAPEGVPLDERVLARAEFDAVFYKIMLYPGQDKNYKMPLLLSRSSRMTPEVGPAVQRDVDPNIVPFIFGAAVVVAIAAAIVVLRRTKADWIPRDDADEVAKLHDVDMGPDVMDTLAYLEQEDETVPAVVGAASSEHADKQPAESQSHGDESADHNPST